MFIGTSKLQENPSLSLQTALALSGIPNCIIIIRTSKARRTPVAHLHITKRYYSLWTPAR